MATSNFKQWNPTAANQENDSAYNSDAQRTGGAPVGVAFPSATANKLYFQLSTMVAALGNFFVNQGVSVSDASLATLTTAIATALNAFVVAITGYSGGAGALTAFIQTVLGYPGGFTPVQQGGGPGQAPGQKLNFGWDGSSPRLAVNGTDVGQLIRLADFTNYQALSEPGVQLLPGGLIIQWGELGLPAGGPTIFNFPYAFPNACFCVVASYQSATPPGQGAVGADPLSGTQARFWNSIASGGPNGIRYIAIGF